MKQKDFDLDGLLSTPDEEPESQIDYDVLTLVLLTCLSVLGLCFLVIFHLTELSAL